MPNTGRGAARPAFTRNHPMLFDERFIDTAHARGAVSALGFAARRDGEASAAEKRDGPLGLR